MSASDPSLEDIAQSLPEETRSHLQWLVYGRVPQTEAIPESVLAAAREGNFEIAKYVTPYVGDTTRAARKVTIAAVQFGIVLPTTEPFQQQYAALERRAEQLIRAAAAAGANIIGLQEAWTAPFFFCTREKRPWLEFAQSAEDGPSVRWACRLALELGIVIVSPILERDDNHGGTIWNTAVVISDSGRVLGKHRKNHIPRVGDFNESTYYAEGNTGHAVFVTRFGKIGINICYGRHHPLNWMMLGLNGAEVVFNPSATVGTLSEPLWPIEARNASIVNTYFVAAINRVGTEVFPHPFTSGDKRPAHTDFGHFYGSSYIAAPDGSRTPGLSRSRDGVVLNAVDLNQCLAVKDMWTFQMTARYDVYAEGLARYIRHDFEPQRIVDPALKDS